jgi:HEAT repeat protein
MLWWTLWTLRTALKSKDVQTRVRAVQRLGDLRNERAVGLLLQAFQDNETNVSGAAREAMGKIGNAAVEPLVTALGDAAVSKPAVEALVRIGSPAMQPLLAALRHSDRSVKGFMVRNAAAEALGGIGDAQAVEPLVDALLAFLKGQAASTITDPVEVVKALAKIGDVRAVEPLLAALQMDLDSPGGPGLVAESVMLALGKISDPRAVEPLTAALGVSRMNRHAVEALESVGDAAVEPLVRVLRDSRPEHARGAARALAKMGGRARERLVVEALQHGEKDVRWHAADALGEIGDARAVEPLIEALRDSREWVRATAARRLGGIRDPRAVEPLRAASEDTDANVRRAAGEALRTVEAKGSVPSTTKAVSSRVKPTPIDAEQAMRMRQVLLDALLLQSKMYQTAGKHAAELPSSLSPTDYAALFVQRVQAHRARMMAAGPDYQEFLQQHLSDDVLAMLAPAAAEKMNLTESDGDEHSIMLAGAPVCFVLCTVPVATREGAHWYERRYGGYTRVLEHCSNSDMYRSSGSEVLCHITYGHSGHETWVNITLLPVHSAQFSFQPILAIDLLSPSEKRVSGIE